LAGEEVTRFEDDARLLAGHHERARSSKKAKELPMPRPSIAFAFALAVLPAHAADVEHGRQVFQSCAACHSDNPDALGPSLVGVIGRKAGSRDDFRYSSAMTRAGFNWDAANLRDYLKDPQAKVRGNRMPFSGLADPKDVDDVIAYIGTLK
jgi:cytochrome c